MLSFGIYFGAIRGPQGLPSPVFEPGIQILAIPQSTAAANGILRPGDVVLAINGRPLTQSASPSMMEAQKGVNQFISLIRATPDGEEVELSILRRGSGSGGNDDNVQIVRVQPKRVGSNKGDQNNSRSRVFQSDNAIEAARLAFQYTYTLTADTAQGLGEILSQFVLGSGSGSGSEGGDGGASISGPVGLIRTGSEVVATRDFQTVLLFAAAVSINLGVVNAFPLPVFDGGQLLFVLAEAVTQRKLDPRVQESIASVAALFLVYLTLSATVGDISSLLGR